MDRGLVAAIVREELERSLLATRVRQLQAAGRMTPVRSMTVTAAAGANGYPVDTSGLTTAVGVVVLVVQAASHWDFAWFPRIADVVIRNDGASQAVTVRYYVLGA
jgi:hypothetical protein